VSDEVCGAFAAVNAPILPEVLSRLEASAQADLPLAAEGVQRYLWESRFGPVLIEVKDGHVYVNEQVVEPAEPSSRPTP
jgi:hypothetical protein